MERLWKQEVKRQEDRLLWLWSEGGQALDAQPNLGQVAQSCNLGKVPTTFLGQQ